MGRVGSLGHLCQWTTFVWYKVKQIQFEGIQQKWDKLKKAKFNWANSNDMFLSNKLC